MIRRSIFNSKDDFEVSIEFYSRFQDIANNSDEIFWSIDLSHGEKVDYVSPAFRKIWGIPEKELYKNQRIWTNSIFRDDKKRVIRAFNNFIKGNGDFNIEWRIVNKKKEVVWISAHGKTIKGLDGKIKRAIGTATDVTERKKREEDMQIFEAFVKNSNVAIIVKDMNMRILQWNKYAEKLYGYSAESVIGKSIKIIVPKEHDDVRKIMGLLKKGIQIKDYNTVRRRKDGRLVSVSLSIAPIIENGKITKAAVVAREIT